MPVKGNRTLAALLFAVLATRLGSAQSAQVQSILNQCVSCHAGAKPVAGLNLKTREAALKGGKSGPALILGNPDGSLLFKMVSARKMPPGNPLAALEISAVRDWIHQGAPWVDADEPQRADSNWWSLRPVSRPSVPAADSSWIQNPIDAFVWAKLQAKGLGPRRRPIVLRYSVVRRSI